MEQSNENARIGVTSSHKVLSLFQGRFSFADKATSSDTMKQLCIIGIISIVAFVILSIRDSENLSNSLLLGSPNVGAQSESIPLKLNFYTQEGEAAELLNGKKKGSSQAPNPLLSPDLVIWTPLDDVHIPAGTLIKARTLVSIDKSTRKVVATLTENLKLKGDIVAEAKSRIFGKSELVDDRYQLSFFELKTRSGSIKVNAIGVDKSDELAGLLPSDVKKRALSVAKNITFTFLGGLAEGLQGGRGYRERRRVSDALLEGGKQVATDEAREAVNESRLNKNEVPSIGQGREFIIEFLGDSDENKN